MIEEFKIGNFKCFKEFKLENLGRVNIFLGENNVGKSSILEAIFGYACGKNLAPLVDNTILRIGRTNNENFYNLMERTLNTFNDRKKLEFFFEAKFKDQVKVKKFSYKLKPSFRFGELEAELNPNHFIPSNIGPRIEMYPNQIPTESFFSMEFSEDNKRKKEEIIYYPRQYGLGLTIEQPFKSATFLNHYNFKNYNELIRIYSLLKRDKNGLTKIITELNKAFQNDIQDIEMIPYPDGSQSPISIKTAKGNYIPIYEYGDGMQKWFFMIGNQLIYKNAYHCLDEIGDMLHPKAQGILGFNLSRLAEENNNQIFSTTQSLEFVKNYLEYVFENDQRYLEDIRVITLKNFEKDIKIRVLDGKESYELLTENLAELR